MNAKTLKISEGFDWVERGLQFVLTLPEKK